MDVNEMKEKVQIGLTFDEVTEILGPPTSDAGRAVRSIFGSSTAKAASYGRQYLTWNRPEGKWQLVFEGNKLVDIYATPE